MPLSLYDIAVPIILQMLGSLSAILDKAADYAREQGIDPAELVNARLAPDMLPLSKQVQIATDHAKGAVARLAGRDVPKFEDTEATSDQLKERIAKTVAFVRGVDASAFDGAEDREVSLKIGQNQMTLAGRHYLLGFALPNFLFHVTTAYGILRSRGVQIGKRDFIGTPRLS